MTVYFTDINHMIAFIITYTCQLLQLMSYKIDVQNFCINLKTLWCYKTVLFASNRAFDHGVLFSISRNIIGLSTKNCQH